MDGHLWTDIYGRTNIDEHWTELQQTSNKTKRNIQPLRWMAMQECCKMIHIRELCNDGVQKKKKILKILFFTFSMDLATYSFDHSCKELRKMELK
jgi:hypothetical protein